MWEDLDIPRSCIKSAAHFSTTLGKKVSSKYIISYIECVNWKYYIYNCYIILMMFFLFLSVINLFYLDIPVFLLLIKWLTTPILCCTSVHYYIGSTPLHLHGQASIFFSPANQKTLASVFNFTKIWLKSRVIKLCFPRESFSFSEFN